MNKHVSILMFSSRANGNCSAVGTFIQNFLSNDLVSLYTIDSTVFAPCNCCDYECLRAGVLCPNLSKEQTEIMDALCCSDIVYYIIPNYCGAPSANYYAFNERSVGYFNLDRQKLGNYMSIQKRFIIISNTEVFTEAAKQQTNAAPEILYLKTGKYKKQSIAGDILDSEEARADLREFLLLGNH